MDNLSFADRIASLDETQLRYVYSRLIMELEIDEEPVLTREDLERRQSRDQALLKEIATSLQITQAHEIPERDVAVQLLSIIREEFPEYHQTISDALDEIDTPSVTLDFGLTFAVSVLVIAVAAAIVRPRVIVQEKRAKNKDGETVERKADVQVQGVNDIANVIGAIFSLLPKS